MEIVKSQVDSQSNWKRNLRACERCRARKVRCDASPVTGICTNCRLDNEVCTVLEQRPGRSKWIDGLKRRRPNGLQSDQESDSTSPLNRSSQSLSRPGISIGESHGSPDATVNLNLTLSLSPNPLVDLNAWEKLDIASKASLPSYISPLPSSLIEEDHMYLQAKGVLSIPETMLRNELLRSFVEYVYPFLPLVNLEDLLVIVQQGDGKHGQLSLLLFQALMLAGSGFIDMQFLKSAGFSSRQDARRMFFQKVKLLYEFDMEPSYTHRIQALLLMTYGYEELNEQKDMWYWMGIVVMLSNTSGLHHCPEREDNSEKENRLNRRLWWCIYMRNQLVAFGMRRRARIRHKDRISMLTVSDFECDSMPSHIIEHWKDCLILRDPIQRKQLAGLCIEKCKLTICVAELMSAHFKTRTILLPRGTGTMPMLIPKYEPYTQTQGSPHGQRLDQWVQSLPPVYQYDSMTSLSGYESPVMIVNKAILRLLYLTSLCALQCPLILPVTPIPEILSLSLKAAKEMDQISRSILQRIGDEILCIAMDLQTLNLVHHLPSTSLSPMLASMLIILVEIQYPSKVVVADIAEKAKKCSSIIRELCVNYPVAEPLSEIFEKAVNDPSSITHLTSYDHNLSYPDVTNTVMATDASEGESSTLSWTYYLESQDTPHFSAANQFSPPNDQWPYQVENNDWL